MSEGLDFKQAPEEPTFDDLHQQLYHAHDESKRRSLLAKMERTATTIQELTLVRNNIDSNTSMQQIIERRIKALQEGHSEYTDA